jgi:hypothetical protein
MGWIMPSQNLYFEVLTPITSECDFIWIQGLYSYNKAEWVSIQYE